MRLLAKSRYFAHRPHNSPKPAPIQAPGVSVVASMPVRFWRWYSFLLGTPSREAVAVYLWGRLHELSRYFAHGFETEPQGANKVHKQQQKRSHSPWQLSRASRALGGALLMGVGWVSRGRGRTSEDRT